MNEPPKPFDDGGFGGPRVVVIPKREPEKGFKMLIPKHIKVDHDKGIFLEKQTDFGVEIGRCYDSDDGDSPEPAMALHDIGPEAGLLLTHVSTDTIRALGHFLIVQADALDAEVIKTYGMKYWKRKMKFWKRLKA